MRSATLTWQATRTQGAAFPFHARRRCTLFLDRENLIRGWQRSRGLGPATNGLARAGCWLQIAKQPVTAWRRMMLVNEQTCETNASNQTTTFGYDAVGNQTSVTDPLGDVTKYAYNAANEETSMTDPLNNTTTYKYDAAGEQISIPDPLGNITAYTYTPRGEVASETLMDPFGIVVQQINYSYAGCGCPIATTVVNPTFTPGSIGGGIGDTSSSGTFSATPGGSLSGSCTIDLSGEIWDGSYSQIGTISGTLTCGLSGSVASNGVFSGSYSGSGSFTISGVVNGSGELSISGTVSGSIPTNEGTVTGSLFGGLVAQLTGNLSASGALSGSIETSGSNSSMTLNGYGGGEGTISGSFSGAAGQQTTYQRNAVHQVTSVTDGDGNTTSYKYDKNGNVTSVTDGNGNMTAYAYNAMNAVTSVTNPLNQTTAYAYDALGDLTSVTDPLGNDPAYTYDAQGRVLTATDNDGGVTEYSYDLAGNETSITDPDGNVTKYSYDAANELLSTTNPNGYQSTNAYNAGGLLTATTDADGRTIDYGYNADGQETSQTWVNGNYTAAYGYNADGELSSASDPFSTYTYTYDALGDVTSVSNAGTPGVPTVTLNYGYDNFGNRTSLMDSLGGNVSYSYDGDNQLTGLGLSVNGMTAAQVTMSYDAAGNLSGLTRTSQMGMGDTITSSYSYDKANELTNITDVDATTSTTLASYSYGYNANGDVSSYQDNSGNSLTYGYDAADQLTSASGSLAGSNYTFLYNYDPNGNRTSTSTDVNGSLISETYSTGTGNELTSDGTYKYTYDNNGNTLTQTDIATGSVTYYTWDYENRLTEVKQETSNGTVLNDEKFTYDVLGNRIGVSLNGTQQLYTVYDGSNPYMDFNGSGTLTERYLTDPNALSQFYGQVDASGTPEWFLTDNLGSIRQVISASGSSLDGITYDPYGNIVSQTNSANTPRFLYTGAAYDAISGTETDGKREDDTLDGRWESPDQLGLQVDSNLFRYVFNSPLDEMDPTGMAPPAGAQDYSYNYDLTNKSKSGGSSIKHVAKQYWSETTVRAWPGSFCWVKLSGTASATIKVGFEAQPTTQNEDDFIQPGDYYIKMRLLIYIAVSSRSDFASADWSVAPAPPLVLLNSGAATKKADFPEETKFVRLKAPEPEYVFATANLRAFAGKNSTGPAQAFAQIKILRILFKNKSTNNQLEEWRYPWK